MKGCSPVSWDGSKVRKFMECAFPDLLDQRRRTVVRNGLRRKYRSRIQIFDGQAS